MKRNEATQNETDMSGEQRNQVSNKLVETKEKFAGPWPTGVLENKFWLFLVNPPYPPERP